MEPTRGEHSGRTFSLSLTDSVQGWTASPHLHVSAGRVIEALDQARGTGCGLDRARRPGCKTSCSPVIYSEPNAVVPCPALFPLHHVTADVRRLKVFPGIGVGASLRR